MADQPLTPEPPTLHLPRRRFLVTSGAVELAPAFGGRALPMGEPARRDFGHLARDSQDIRA